MSERDGLDSNSADLAMTGYWQSPWPGEDAGPRRSQAPHGVEGLRIADGERLEVASRDACGITMVILRDPGQVYVLRHTFGSNMLNDPVIGWVERIHPHTLEVLERSPDLKAGPFWPGGLAAHANGSLYTVFGRWCHRLAPDCSVIARSELPQPSPYNSFVILADGTIVTKDCDRKGISQGTRLTLLEPERLQPRCAEVQLPERSVARLSSDGNAIYVIGMSTAYRYIWDPEAAQLHLDESWSFRYGPKPGKSYGWDPVIEGEQMWFLDNGDHTYTTSMLHAGVAPSPVQLLRASLKDAADHGEVDVCGQPHGSVTNPPLYDPQRNIALGYDSANSILTAWRLTQGSLERLWQREYSTATHMIRYPDTGEVVINDFRDGFPLVRSHRLRRLTMRGGRLISSPRVRAMASRRSTDNVVIIDIESGQERARAAIPSMTQGVVFPAVGWSRDLYYPTMTALARLSVV
ncbi:MAG: hypothetical protein K0U84_21925 [Actinomycetia bacterium]|nr:hypothetical protein [Actinomycetes bacterium]